MSSTSPLRSIPVASTPTHPAATAARPAIPSPWDARDATTLLGRIMPVARLALWEAWDNPLELIALHFGQTDRPMLALEPAQRSAGASWIENVYPPDRASLRAFLDEPDAVRAARPVDYRLIVAEGELLWVRHWLLHRAAAESGRHHLQGLLMPIPEQKHLEWECLRVSERECNRIGQDLHDDLCQVLSGLSFMMHVLARRAATVVPDVGAEIEELNSQVIDATERVRSMAHGLFPAQLNYGTLRDALNEFSRDVRKRYAIRVVLDLPRKLPPHSPEQIIQVYRIVQEAVGNAVRHGGAGTIQLRVTSNSHTLQLEVEDDRKGLPATAVRPEGIGMHVMQYRARVLGGTIRTENMVPHGAAVRLTYPASYSGPTHRKQDPLL